MFCEELKQLDAQITNQMFWKAHAEWSYLHAPLEGTYRPFHLGGSIDEATVINDNKDLDSRINTDYVHYLFEKLEAEGKGQINKGFTWTFTFNEHQSIYSPLDKPCITKKDHRHNRL